MQNEEKHKKSEISCNPSSKNNHCISLFCNRPHSYDNTVFLSQEMITSMDTKEIIFLLIVLISILYASLSVYHRPWFYLCFRNDKPVKSCKNPDRNDTIILKQDFPNRNPASGEGFYGQLNLGKCISPPFFKIHHFSMLKTQWFCC